MSPKGHQQTLTLALRRYRLHKDVLGLRAYLRGDVFLTHLGEISPIAREAIFRMVVDTMTTCQEAVPKPKRQATRQWTPARIERLRQAYQTGRDDLDLHAAMACGVTPDAAKRARSRYLADATQQAA